MQISMTYCSGTSNINSILYTPFAQQRQVIWDSPDVKLLPKSTKHI